MQSFNVILLVWVTFTILAPGGRCFIGKLRLGLSALAVEVADADGDGELSVAEADAVLASLQLDPASRRLDVDGDGRLSVDELDAVLALSGKNVVASLDRDGDGRLAVDEAVGALRRFGVTLPTQVWALVDADADGRLDAAEIDAIEGNVPVWTQQLPAEVMREVEDVLTRLHDNIKLVLHVVILPAFDLRSSAASSFHEAVMHL